jgi:hypothetical protein
MVSCTATEAAESDHYTARVSHSYLTLSRGDCYNTRLRQSTTITSAISEKTGSSKGQALLRSLSRFWTENDRGVEQLVSQRSAHSGRCESWVAILATAEVSCRPIHTGAGSIEPSTSSYTHRASSIRDLPPQETPAGDTDYRHPQWLQREQSTALSAVLISKINRSHCELLGCDVSICTAILHVTTLPISQITQCRMVG